jgi:alpha-1,2-mannosyltransferase
VAPTELASDTRTGPMRNGAAAWVTARAGDRQSMTAAIIAVCAAIALLLRGYQLTRPGYLLGVTEYDDGALFGNALRLVAGVLPYRDFSMVQPPGSMLLMAPAALLAKVAGTAWGLAAARLLTVCADTANVVLLGALVRHRGPLTTAIACGTYAVYPDAIGAAHTLLLEPWLNLFCLAAATLIFTGDHMTGTTPHSSPAEVPARRLSDAARLFCGGLLFGFAVAIKIWALVPLGIAALLLALTARRLRPPAMFAGGAAVGLGVPLLPFAVLAPGALMRGVLIGQFVRDADGPRHLLWRLADLAGLRLLSFQAPDKLLLAAITAAIIGCSVAACLLAGRMCGDRKVGPLDGYALACAVAVTAILLWPRLYYSHYGSFDGPFLALALALPVGLLTAARPPNPQPAASTATAPTATASITTAPITAVARAAVARATVATALVLMIAAAGCLQFQAESRLRGSVVAGAVDRLIPAGACVVSNDAADTVAADRFYSDDPGCPQLVDSYGTFFATTSGLLRAASPATLQLVINLWQTALDRAQYVWLTTNTYYQIPWNSQLSNYFRTHFRIIGSATPPILHQYIPPPALYARTPNS